ncbi:MAG TPA: PaaI family thioesterase [Longimicrobiales bacterium]|nr:PaaI family thioesterase [Longimicrobiales bacterium]
MPDRTLTITWDDPLPTAAAARRLSGLDFLRAMLRGEYPPPPMAMMLGFRLKAVEPGRVVFRGEPGEMHYNPIGVVHGGLAATLCDSAGGCAVATMLPAGVGYTTLEIKVNFVRPLTRDTGPVECEARVLHAGGRVATAEARLTDAAGRLCAHATTTCLILRPDAPRPGAGAPPG